MTARRWLLVGIAVLALLLLAGRAVAGLYTDYLWYDALGATSLWWTRMGALGALRSGCALVAGLFAFANLYAVRQSVVSLVLQRQLANVEFGEEVPGRYLLVAAIVVSIVLAIALAAPEDDWVTFLAARSAWSAPFGEADPYTGSDLGYFVYWLPFENHLWGWALALVLVVCAVVVLMYALTPSLRWQSGSLHLSAYVRRHFTVLLGVLLLLFAWSCRLDMYSRLVQGSGADGAFSFADHRVGIPGDLILSLLSLGAALVVMYAGLSGQFRLAASAVLTVVIIVPLIRLLAPFIIEHGGSDAERRARERPYIATQASYTRRAFELDAIDTASATLLEPAGPGDLPVWDSGAIARVAAGGKANRTAWFGWQSTPRGLTAAVVGPQTQTAGRADGPGGDNPSWSAAHVLVGGTDDRGALVGVDSSGDNASEGYGIASPLVYPDAKGVVLVRDSLGRIAGIPLDASAVRLAAAWSLQDLRIISGDLPRPSPAAVVERDVRERVERVMPFLTPSHHVQVLLAGDSVYWAVDLYATSESYPLSRHFDLLDGSQSYLHHAAVAVVQGATGEVVVVADSTLDAMGSNWVRRFPNLFGSWSSLPAGLRSQLEPRVDAVFAKASAFAQYGSRSGGELTRRVPELDGADSAFAGQPPAVEALAMAGVSGGPSLAVSLPVVDESDRIRGLLVGLGEPAGPPPKNKRLASGASIIWLPLSRSAERWTTIIDQLRSADSMSAPQHRRSPGALLRGPVRAVPVRGAAMYLQASYRSDPDDQLVLDHVAMLSGDSLRVLLPGSAVLRVAGNLRGAGSGLTGKNAVSARALYDAMRDALRRGDWGAFGRAFDELGRLLGTRPR